MGNRQWTDKSKLLIALFLVLTILLIILGSLIYSGNTSPVSPVSPISPISPLSPPATPGDLEGRALPTPTATHWTSDRIEVHHNIAGYDGSPLEIISYQPITLSATLNFIVVNENEKILLSKCVPSSCISDGTTPLAPETSGTGEFWIIKYDLLDPGLLFTNFDELSGTVKVRLHWHAPGDPTRYIHTGTRLQRFHNVYQYYVLVIDGELVKPDTQGWFEIAQIQAPMPTSTPTSIPIPTPKLFSLYLPVVLKK